MIHDGHVGWREAIALTTLFSTTKIFLSFPQQMVELGATAGWQIPLVAGVWTGIIMFLIYGLYTKTSGRSMFDVAFANGGKVFGFLSSFVYTLFFLGLGAVILREFTETVVSTVLPGTPVSAVAIPFMLAIIYIGFKGTETITRVGLLIFPIFVVGVVLIFVLNSNHMNPLFLLPFRGWGTPSVLYHSFLRISDYSELFILVLLIPAFRKKHEFRKACIWTLVYTWIIFTLTVIFYLMIFPVESASRLPFPMFQISRLIYLGRFLQRIESIFVFIWVCSAVIKVGLCLWASSFSIAEGIRIPMYKPLIVPMAMIMYGLSFIPRNFPETANWDKLVFHNWVGLIPFAFVLVLYALVRIRKQGSEKV